MKIPHSGVRLEPCPKGYKDGLEKVIPPAETIRNVRHVLDQCGMQLIGNVFRIDRGRFDIPVYVCRPGKDCNIPAPKTMGRGYTAEQGEASALMEMIERFSYANFPRPEVAIQATFKEVEKDAIAFEEFFRIPGLNASVSSRDKEDFLSLPFSWVPAYSLVKKRDFLVPFEWFADIQGTNGLSAGNTLTEAVLRGLCEVVERHVCALVNVRKEPTPTIDLYTVKDPVARDLVGKFAINHIRLLCKDFSMDTGIPTVGALAIDSTTFPESEIVYCAGTSAHPEKALIRVLTEIQQMAVDDFRQNYYAGGVLPKFRNWREAYYLFDDRKPVPIQTMPDLSSDDMLVELEHCTEALSRIGLEPLVVNITHPVLNIPSVFVIVPGSQLYDSTVHQLNPTFYIGRRLEFLKRFEEAMERFRISMEEHPGSRLHCSVEIANCLRCLRRWDEAVEMYRDTYRYGPDQAMQSHILQSLEICLDKLR